MELKTVAFDAAPLKIITAQREFVDDRNLDLDEMIVFLSPTRGGHKAPAQILRIG